MRVAVEAEDGLALLDRADEEEVRPPGGVYPLLPRLLGVGQTDADGGVGGACLLQRVVVTEEDGHVVPLVTLPVVERRVDACLLQPAGPAPTPLACAPALSDLVLSTMRTAEH